MKIGRVDVDVPIEEFFTASDKSFEAHFCDLYLCNPVLAVD